MPLALDPLHLATVRRILAFWAPGLPVFAFGSRAHGHHLKPTSDLDLCLKGETAVATKTLRDLKNAFEISDLPMRVDVVDWDALAPEFRNAIANDLVEVADGSGAGDAAIVLKLAEENAGLKAANDNLVRRLEALEEKTPGQ